MVQQVITNSYIVKTSGICGGRARIDGTRLPVETIVGMYQAGASIDEIVEGYRDIDLTRAKVHAALAYYYDHQAEIDAILDEYERLAEEGKRQQAARRKQAGLPPIGSYITSREAAAILDVDHESRWVARLCREGQLDCRKVGRDWLVSRASVEAYAERNRQSGTTDEG